MPSLYGTSTTRRHSLYADDDERRRRGYIPTSDLPMTMERPEVLRKRQEELEKQKEITEKPIEKADEFSHPFDESVTKKDQVPQTETAPSFTERDEGVFNWMKHQFKEGFNAIKNSSFVQANDPIGYILGEGIKGGVVETISGLGEELRKAVDEKGPEGMTGTVAKEWFKEVWGLKESSEVVAKDFFRLTLPKFALTVTKMAAENAPQPVIFRELDANVRNAVADKLDVWIDGLEGIQREHMQELGITDEMSPFHPLKFGYNVTHGGMSMASALAITLLTKNPVLAGTFLGAVEGSDSYLECQDSGGSDGKCLTVAGTNMVGISVLESLSLKWMFANMSGGFFSQASKKATLEVFQETSQTVWSNLVEKVGYNPAKGIFDNIWETMIYTFPVGFLSGGGISMLETTQLQGTTQEEQLAIMDQLKIEPELVKQRIGDIATKVDRILTGEIKTDTAQLGTVGQEIMALSEQKFDSPGHFYRTVAEIINGQLEGEQRDKAITELGSTTQDMFISLKDKDLNTIYAEALDEVVVQVVGETGFTKEEALRLIMSIQGGIEVEQEKFEKSVKDAEKEAGDEVKDEDVAIKPTIDSERIIKKLNELNKLLAEDIGKENEAAIGQQQQIIQNEYNTYQRTNERQAVNISDDAGNQLLRIATTDFGGKQVVASVEASVGSAQLSIPHTPLTVYDTENMAILKSREAVDGWLNKLLEDDAISRSSRVEIARIKEGMNRMKAKLTQPKIKKYGESYTFTNLAGRQRKVQYGTDSKGVQQLIVSDTVGRQSFIAFDDARRKYTESDPRKLAELVAFGISDKKNKGKYRVPEGVEEVKETQKETVKKVVKKKVKATAKEVAEETGIKEANIRRILGTGAKEGTFERVEQGVYVLSKNDQDIAYIETGDAMESLPRLIEKGFKADMIFLDIPYKTSAVVGGNRGVKYETITTEQFNDVLLNLEDVVKDENTPVFYMYSQAKSGLRAMEKYNTLIADKFTPIARGEYTKLQLDGITRVRNMRGNIIEPEGLILFSKSGKLDPALKPITNADMDFKLIRPDGWQSEKAPEMMKQLIEMSTQEGDVVLDPFAGSGVTGEQAIEAKRKTYLIEKEEKAVERIIKPRVEMAAVKDTSPEYQVFSRLTPADFKAFDEYSMIVDLQETKNQTKINRRERMIEDGLIRKQSDGSLEITELGNKVLQLKTAKHFQLGLHPMETKGITEKQMYADQFIYGTVDGRKFGTNAFVFEWDLERKETFGKEKDEKMPGEGITKFLKEHPTDKAQTKITPYAFSYSEATPMMQMQTKDGIKTTINANYFNYIEKKYKNPDFFIVKEDVKDKHYNGYIVFKDKDGNDLGFLMPVMDSAIEENEKMITVEKAKLEPKPKAIDETPQDSLIDIYNATYNQEDRTKMSEIVKKRNPEGKTEVEREFKLSTEAKQILTDFNIPIAEKTLSKKYRGIFKHMSEKIRVQSIYDIPVVVHETTHALDFRHDISKLVRQSENEEVIAELTEVYEEFYPNGKASHPLSKRIVEGLATYIQYYFLDPEMMASKYPSILEEFIQTSGSFYNKDITVLLEKMNTLVDDYAKLSPEQRVGARIMSGEEVVKKDTGFNAKQRIIFQAFNRLEVLKRYTPQELRGTMADPTLAGFDYMGKDSYSHNWLFGKERIIALADGNVRMEKGTVKDLMEMIEDDEEAFKSYLVSRRVAQDHNKIIALDKIFTELGGEDHITELEEMIREAREEEKDNPEAVKDLAFMRAIQKQRDDQIKIVNNDDFSLPDAQAVVRKYEKQFKEPTKLFDSINRSLVDQMAEFGLISKGQAEEYKQEEGYASFRRYIDDEIALATGFGTTSSKAKVTSLRNRKGSMQPIIDPVFSQMSAIAEIFNKGFENRIWERVAMLSRDNVELARRFEMVQTMAAVDKNGKISFPQEHDPSFVRVWHNGKRKFFKVAPEFQATIKTLRPSEFDATTKIIQMPAAMFTRLTTSANPLFALGNITIDQFSAAAQTKTKLKPGIDPAKGLVDFTKNVFDKEPLAKQFLAGGGRRTTLAAFHKAISPEQIEAKIQGGQTMVEKAYNAVDLGLSVLEMPSNTSEYLSRYSEYKRAIADGKTHSEAMYAANEVTVPFQLHGNLGGKFGVAVIRSIPYFNASLQVMYKFARASKDNPLRVGTVAATIMAAGLTATIAIMRGADDETKRQLAQLPVSELSRGLFFGNPFGKGLIRIRIPEQFGGPLALVQLYVFSHYDQNKPTFDEYLEAATAWIPDQLNITEPSKGLLTWLPQIAKPTIQTIFNKKVYPEVLPIVPYYEERSTMPKDQYNEYTTKIAVAVGQLTGWSPKLFDHWIREQFGAVGDLLMETGGKVGGKTFWDELSRKFPLFRQEDHWTMMGRSYNTFYENRDIIEKQWKKLKDDRTIDPRERYDTKMLNDYHKDLGDVLSDMRKMTKRGEELPENIKQEAYMTMLLLNNASNNTNLTNEDFADINAILRKLESEVIYLLPPEDRK